MDEHLQPQPGGAGGGHGLYFIDGQFAGQHDGVGRQPLSDEIERGRERHVRQGGPDHLARKTGLAHERRHGQILHDDGIRLHLALQLPQEPAGLIQLAGGDQGVECHEDAGALRMGQRGEGCQLSESEVLGLHARRKRLQPAVNGLRAGRQRGQERGPVAGRSQNGRDRRERLFRFRIRDGRHVHISPPGAVRVMKPLLS